MTKAFPADWPPHCPPADAEDARGEVFRLVMGAPLVLDHFRSHAELGTLLKAPPCLRVGLSVFRTIEETVHQRELLPYLGDRIAKAELAPDHGKAKLTRGKQPTHTTWWPYSGVDRASLFAVVQVLP